MIRDLHHYLRHYVFSRKIQRAWRQYIVRQFNRTQGPAVFNRSICNNTEDFLTMETMQEIEYIFLLAIGIKIILFMVFIFCPLVR